MDMNDAITRFRIASRELFNNYIYPLYDRENALNDKNWEIDTIFAQLNAALFRAMVAKRFELGEARYGEVNPDIGVNLKYKQTVPIQVNRGIDTGYWDFPLKEVSPQVRLSFIDFFDWDSLGIRDYQYVRTKIEEWPEHPEAVGKQGLIEARYVEFSPGKPSP